MEEKSTAKTERFEMRLDKMTADRVDAWRGDQPDFPSRAEAVRRLIEKAVTEPEGLRFSGSELLMVQMLADIHKATVRDGEINADFVSSVMTGGHHWALKWQYPGLFHSHVDTEGALNLVVDTLDMWTFMEEAYEGFSKEQKKKIEEEVGVMGKHVKFPGFDGNNEGEYISIARFLVQKMDRFTRFTKRDLNSHTTLVSTYRRMTSEFDDIRSSLVGHGLNPKQVTTLLKTGWPRSVS